MTSLSTAKANMYSACAINPVCLCTCKSHRCGREWISGAPWSSLTLGWRSEWPALNWSQTCLITGERQITLRPGGFKPSPLIWLSATSSPSKSSSTTAADNGNRGSDLRFEVRFGYVPSLPLLRFLFKTLRPLSSVAADTAPLVLVLESPLGTPSWTATTSWWLIPAVEAVIFELSKCSNVALTLAVRLLWPEAILKKGFA